MRVAPFGPAAWLVEVDRTTPAADAIVARRLAHGLEPLFAGADVVVGGASVLLAGAERAPRPEEIERALASSPSPTTGRTHALEIDYDGPDLAHVASTTRRRVQDVVALHQDASYTVEVAGFLPGFAYLGEVDEALVLPRRASPRKVVPAGSVGIAGRYTGVYPFDSPGGWHLLGTMRGTRLFDPARDPPALLAPGDTVTFVRVGDGPRPQRGAPPREAIEDAHLRLARCPPHATVQDHGRALRRRGIPSSGPLDRATHDAANQALGNATEAATIELPLDGLEAEVLRDVWISVDGGPPERLRAGERLAVPACERAVRYLAMEGGVDVPLVLGARATLPVAGLGGLDGRRLRRGDTLRARGSSAVRPAASTLPPATRDREALPIVAGPHAARFDALALDRLCERTWTISTARDRVGTRLEGDPIPRHGAADAGAPDPMLPGAIQISTDGMPIVLGPDAAVTGGYPVLAVLVGEGRDRLARARSGLRVRFVLER